MKTMKVTFISSSTKKISIICEIAHTMYEKEQGLMGRKKLDESKGMLFIFSFPFLRCFWMKGIEIPLDIIFIRKKKITKIFHAYPDTIHWVPKLYCGIATQVIECKQGFCQMNKIKKGTMVDF